MAVWRDSPKKDKRYCVHVYFTYPYRDFISRPLPLSASLSLILASAAESWFPRIVSTASIDR